MFCSRMMIGTVCLTAALAAASAPAMADETQESSSQASVEGDADRLPHDEFDLLAYGEVDAMMGAASSSQSTVWRAELDGSGDVSIVTFGPGAVDIPLDDETVAYSVSQAYEETEERPSMTPTGWYCTNVKPAKVTKPRYLTSYVGFTCDGVRPGQARVGYNYESSRFWGWGRYDDTRFTTWTSDQAQGTNTYENCNTVDGGTHRYRVRSWIEVRYAGEWYQHPAKVGVDSAEYDCGQGVN